MKAVLAAASFALALGCLAAPARAQGVDEFGSYGADQNAEGYASPQNFALEFRFSPYRPEIDSEFGGATPYETTFGSDRRLMIGMEFDWQALRLERIASIGPAIGMGYTRMSAGMVIPNSGGDRASQATSLNIMPWWAILVGRLDVLARQTVVPLAFYGKVGPAIGLWWVRDGSGTASVDGSTGKGRSDGFFYGAGLMLELDRLDDASARALDSGIGVNHSYLFAEWSVLDLGMSSQMLVGDSTWTIGLALEM